MKTLKIAILVVSLTASQLAFATVECAAKSNARKHASTNPPTTSKKMIEEQKVIYPSHLKGHGAK